MNANHIQKYIKVRTGKEFSIEDIHKIIEGVAEKPFNNERETQLEAYVKNYHNIIYNNLQLHYDQKTQKGSRYTLKSVGPVSNGIFLVEHFLTNDECDQLIQLLERSNKKHTGFTSTLTDPNAGASLQDLSSGNAKKSIDMDLNDFMIYNELDEDGKLFQKFNDQINANLKQIAKNFMTYYIWPGSINDYFVSAITLRRYNIGTCGYSYHNDFMYTCKDGRGQRFMSFVLYLNNVHKGGETKFLHQDVAVTPIKGRLVIFPPTHCHIHTGMPPVSNPKYIITCFLHKNR